MYKTLHEAGLPVRYIRLNSLNEYQLGMLVMHIMIETIVAASVLDINPFNQPAVEKMKENCLQLI